jgi:hypothetical protein
LVDPELQLVGLFGMTNVPFGIWIDEEGTIVRPAEIASAPRQMPAAVSQSAAAQIPDRRRETVAKMTANMPDPHQYQNAVRDWVHNGPASTYVLSEQDVIERSRPRPPEFGLAAAHFALGQHLHSTGFGRDAVPHFQEAHRLDPTNWSYLREALSLVDPAWGQVYERDLLGEVEIVGPDTFYPRLDM